MHITIFRRRFTPWGVDGTMVIDGFFFCGTVEHPKKFLPAGSYMIAPVPIRFQQGKEEFRTMPTILPVKGRVSKTSVLRKPYLKPGFGPFTLKYGSIVMGKSLKTGLVAYSEEKFQEFCDMISDALLKKEKVTLVIKDWEKDDIPKEYMIVLPTNTSANNTPANNNLK